jgi:hypothetical protein
MASTFTLADSFDATDGRVNHRVNMDAPLPLGYAAAVQRAIELREKPHMSWSWRQIADVMAEYHGFSRCPSWWRKTLHGHVTPQPRGPAFDSHRQPKRRR